MKIGLSMVVKNERRMIDLFITGDELRSVSQAQLVPINVQVNVVGEVVGQG